MVRQWVGEEVHLHAEAAVVADVDELLLDGVALDWLTVWSEPHQLVLARVDLEAGEVG